MAVQRTVVGVNDGGDLFLDNSVSSTNNNNSSTTTTNESQGSVSSPKGESGYSRTTAFANSSVN